MSPSSAGSEGSLPKAGAGTGRVLDVHEGIIRLVVAGRVVRATFGGDLLASVASDRDACPRPGDRVRFRTWPDGPVTVESVVARAVRRPDS